MHFSQQMSQVRQLLVYQRLFLRRTGGVDFIVASWIVNPLYEFQILRSELQGGPVKIGSWYTPRGSAYIYFDLVNVFPINVFIIYTSYSAEFYQKRLIRMAIWLYSAYWSSTNFRIDQNTRRSPLMNHPCRSTAFFACRNWKSRGKITKLNGYWVTCYKHVYNCKNN